MASKVLGIAGEKVSTFTLTDGVNNKISKIYDLTSYDSLCECRQDANKIVNKFRPDLIACDMHPDLLSTRIAEHLCEKENIPLLRVRHHHAHIAAVLAENNMLNNTCLGLALDGYGYGENGEAWGGELLLVNGTEYKRLGQIKPLRLIGKDAAAKDTKLLKYAFIFDNLGEKKFKNSEPDSSNILLQMLKNNINSAYSSSCGRLFDLACELDNTKGETPIARILNFEAKVTNPTTDSQGYKITENSDGLLQADLSPLLLKSSAKPDFADLFHGTLATALSTMVKISSEKTKIKTVALSGGCILNKQLSSALCKNLEADKITILKNKKLSPTDSSVSFGMAHIGIMHAAQA